MLSYRNSCRYNSTFVVVVGRCLGKVEGADFRRGRLVVDGRGSSGPQGWSSRHAKEVMNGVTVEKDTFVEDLFFLLE